MTGLYVRVSTQEQATEGYSVDEQIERLKSYASAMNWIPCNVYVDAGCSGANTDRPELQRLIADIKAHTIDRVVVYKLDRLSRSQKDTLELIEDVMLRNGCDFVSMSEQFDTGSPFGKAMIGMLAVFAQLEREQIKERLSLGKTGRAKDGRFHGGGYIPVGYDYVDGELIINEYEAMQIREIHKLYQSGLSFSAIERECDRRGYHHKYGKWRLKRIRDCLLNTLYLGDINYRGESYTGLHQAIITPEIYGATKAIYNSRDYSVCRNNGRTAYLSGLIYCARCGARYTSVINRMPSGKVHRYYACHSRRKTNNSMIRDPNCKNKTYRMSELDELVFNEIRKLAIDDNFKATISKADPVSNEAKLIRKELDTIKSQRSRFLDLYGLGTFSAEEIQSKLSPLQEREAKLNDRLRELQNTASKLSATEAMKLVQSFGEALNRADFAELRMLLASLIDRIDIDGDDIIIKWRFA